MQRFEHLPGFVSLVALTAGVIAATPQVSSGTSAAAAEPRRKSRKSAPKFSLSSSNTRRTSPPSRSGASMMARPGSGALPCCSIGTTSPRRLSSRWSRPPRRANRRTRSLTIILAGKNFHVICEVTDDGTHNLTSYRRIMVEPSGPATKN